MEPVGDLLHTDDHLHDAARGMCGGAPILLGEHREGGLRPLQRVALFDEERGEGHGRWREPVPGGGSAVDSRAGGIECLAACLGDHRNEAACRQVAQDAGDLGSLQSGLPGEVLGRGGRPGQQSGVDGSFGCAQSQCLQHPVPRSPRGEPYPRRPVHLVAARNVCSLERRSSPARRGRPAVGACLR